MADVPVEDAALEDDVPAEGEEEGEGEAEASEDKSVDSSEEEEDEDANEYEDDGFVVDEEEGGEGEDEQEDSARKRRKKSKKRKSLKLDDEDYDLLEENQVKARMPCTPCRACVNGCSCMVSGWAAATLCMGRVVRSGYGCCHASVPCNAFGGRARAWPSSDPYLVHLPASRVPHAKRGSFSPKQLRPGSSSCHLSCARPAAASLPVRRTTGHKRL